MGDEKNFSIVSLDDLAGLSAPLKKLVGVIGDGMGRVYHPMAIFLESIAEASKIRRLARANADAEREFDKLQKERQRTSLEIVPELQERAKLRTEMEAIAEQENLERIAAKSIKYMGDTVSQDDVNADWRTRFFKNAREVSDETMREVWARLLAEEVTQPGTYSLRSLEVLRLMSRAEAEALQRLSCLVFEPDYVLRVDQRLDEYGVSFDDILALQGAGILRESFSLSKHFPRRDLFQGPGNCLAVTHDIGINLAFEHPAEVSAYLLTTAGREVRRLVQSKPNMAYVAAVEKALARAGLEVSRFPIQWESGQIRAGGHLINPLKL